MIPCSQDFIKAMSNPQKTLSMKIEVYDSNMNFITSFGDETSNFASSTAPSRFTPYGTLKRISKTKMGGINVDFTKPIRRSFSFGISSSDASEFLWGENNLIWIDKRLKIYVGLLLANGTYEYIPQGVFILGEPSDSHNDQGQITVINGYDKAYLLTDKRGKFGTQTTIASGIKVTDAIMKVAGDVGETQFLFDDITTILTYDVTYTASDNRWKAIQDFADLAKCEVFYDVNGYLRLRAINTNFDSEPSVWTYSSDPSDIFYAGNERKFDETNLANHVQVLGGSSQTATVFYEIVVDEDLTYDLSTMYTTKTDFSTGTTSNTAIIDGNGVEVGDGSITLTPYGTTFTVTENSEGTFNTGTLTNVRTVRESESPMPTNLSDYMADLEITPIDSFLQDWNSQPYTIQNTVVNSVSNSIINVTSLSPNAMFNMFNIGSFDPTVCEYIEIRYRITSPMTTQMNIYYLNSTNTTPSTNYMVSTPTLLADGEWHTIILDMFQDPLWKTGGNITGWGFNWATSQNVTMDIDYIRLNKNAVNSGNRVSPAYDISVVGVAGTSTITWDVLLPTNCSATVHTRVSTDGGKTWGSWATATSGQSIPSITKGMNLQNARLEVMESLSTSDGQFFPSLQDLTITITPEYQFLSGTYTSNTFSVATSEKAGSTACVQWSSETPLNTSLSMQIQYSLDNGNTWSGWQTVLNGQQITSITTIPDVSKMLFQYKTTFTTTDNTESPTLDDITFIVYVPNFWAGNPYSVQKIGRVLYQYNNGSADPSLVTVDDCKWRAKYELMQRLGYSEQVTMALAPNWLHDASDIIDIEDFNNNVAGKYRIQSFNVPLIPELMQVVCVKYRDLIMDWNSI